MKFFRNLYHFLGGVYFALILIAGTALFVIAGTFIESSTQSHRYAALFTYSNPLFAAFLWGFFINILFSATRRWPFKWKHFPFLTTHLGLLMILGGVLMKHYFGLQGSIILSEGSASHDVIEPNTYAISVDKRNGSQTKHYPVQKTLGGLFRTDIAKNEDSLSIRLLEYCPHCQEHLAAWIKGSHVYINGLKPIPIYFVTGEESQFLPAGKVAFYGPDGIIYDLYAFKTADIENTLTKLYLQNIQLAVKDRITDQISLHKFQELPQRFSVSLALNFMPLDGFKDPIMTIGYGTEKISIHLSEDKTLLNLDENGQFSFLPIAVDIQQTPLLAIIEDEFEDVWLVGFDQHGTVWSKAFPKGKPDTLTAYNEGFAGYSVRAELPFKNYNTGRQAREKALANQIAQLLREAETEKTALSPPLQMLLDSCWKSQVDFSDTAAAFLLHWNALPYWLYQENIPLPENLKAPFESLDWKNAPPAAKQACGWVKRLFDQFEPELNLQSNKLIELLRKNGWPLLGALEAEIAQGKEKGINISPFTVLTQQIFAAAEALPLERFFFENTTPEAQASLFSAYLRAHGIHFSEIVQIPENGSMEYLLVPIHQQTGETNSPAITLETAVVPVQQDLPPQKKLEDNFPKITLQAVMGSRAQQISLAYDPTASGLKWPILNGEYLLRFQPIIKEIPYRLRLRQARQINYANSSQPYSFESDLIIKDRRSGTNVEATISMNKVHETWDGYRFYLSSIVPPNETAVRQVHISVNHDPAKYILTYPGAIVLSCGILMLFIMRPYRRPKP